MTGSTRRLSAVTAAAAALVAPFVLAVPAQAATTQDGCTVTPGAPYPSGTVSPAGIKQFDRRITITCDPNRSVELGTQVWEADAPGVAAYVLGGTTTRTFGPAPGPMTQVLVPRATLPMPPLDPDATAELFQVVRFRVMSGAVVGAWTAPERTVTSTITY